MCRGPALFGLQPHFNVVAIELDWLADVERHFAGGGELGQHLAAVGLGNRLFDLGHQLADPRSQPLEIGDDVVGDVLLALGRVFDLLDVQFVAQDIVVRFQPGLMFVVG